MDNSTRLQAQAERHFQPTDNRSEKGSAMRTIAAQNAATQDKSARLKALRLARDAVVVTEPPKPKRSARGKKAV